jgi:hypothetical protein
MTVERMEIKGWKGYLEGEVTKDDVIVEERCDAERLPQQPDPRYRVHPGYLNSKVCISLKDDVKALIYMDSRSSGEAYRVLEVHTPIKTDSEKAIKAARTRHEKSCAEQFTEDNIQEMVWCVIEVANRRIKFENEEFIGFMGRNLECVQDWENKERIDELEQVRQTLLNKAREVEEEKRSIMREEINEWLIKENCNPELRERIVKGFRGVSSNVLTRG